MKITTGCFMGAFALLFLLAPKKKRFRVETKEGNAKTAHARKGNFNQRQRVGGRDVPLALHDGEGGLIAGWTLGRDVSSAPPMTLCCQAQILPANPAHT